VKVTLNLIPAESGPAPQLRTPAADCAELLFERDVIIPGPCEPQRHPGKGCAEPVDLGSPRQPSSLDEDLYAVKERLERVRLLPELRRSGPLQHHGFSKVDLGAIGVADSGYRRHVAYLLGKWPGQGTFTASPWPLGLKGRPYPAGEPPAMMLRRMPRADHDGLARRRRGPSGLVDAKAMQSQDRRPDDKIVKGTVFFGGQLGRDVQSA
jgi:hypothetical protein